MPALSFLSGHHVRVLLVDDDKGFLRQLLPEVFSGHGIEVVGGVVTLDDATALIDAGCVDVVLLDHCEAAGRGSRSLAALLQRNLDVGTVVLLENERPIVMQEVGTSSRAVFATKDDGFDKLTAAVHEASKTTGSHSTPIDRRT